MGATLSTHQETLQNPTPSVEQKEVLTLLSQGLGKLCTTYPTESKYEFKKVLTWQSPSLRPNVFANVEDNNTWNMRRTKNVVVSSNEVRHDGIPFFSLETSSDNSFVAHVGSFEYLNMILGYCGESQLVEFKQILKANKTSLQNILGTSMDASSLLKVLDAMNNDVTIMNETEQKLHRLYLVVNAMDVELMKDSVKTIKKDRVLDIQKVVEELTLLQDFCGKHDQAVLMKIEWDTAYTFSNGCRAPPWRQVFGDLGYIIALPKDGPKLTITASKKGYFFNQGYITDEVGKETLNYEAENPDKIYATLIDLLKNRSSHFTSKIDKQQYRYGTKVERKGGVSNIGANTQTQNNQKTTKQSQNETSNKSTTNQFSSNENKKTEGGRNESKSKKMDTAIEPSSKWKALEGIQIQEISTKKNTGSSSKYEAANAARRKSSFSNVSKYSTKRRVEEEPSDSEMEASEDEEITETREASDLPAEYYQIQKLVRYMRCGNETATVIAICALRDFDLLNDSIQYAIREVGGLETLVNLLDTESIKCKIGALKVLIAISQNVTIRNAIAELDGMQSLVALLKDPEEDVKCLAAEAIAHCAKNAKNRRGVRQYGGIRKLIKLLKSATESKEEKAAISGAMALATCSKSGKNKDAILASDAIPILATLLESKNEALLVPLVALLQECASDLRYRLAMRKAGMLKFLVEGLSSKNVALQTHCASAIFKCAEEDEARILVRQCNGIGPLVSLLDNSGNKELLVAATGAVWKCAHNMDNVATFNKLNTIKKLVQLVDNQPEEVLVNAVGALGACAKSPEARQAIRESGGISPLANLLKGTNQNLLINVTTAVGACAIDSESMVIIDRLDGVRLLWSLLKSSNPHVQASAAWAIGPCIEQAKDAGEMVRSFVGGLELIVSLLKSDNLEVLASVCSVIAKIAKDEENLAVISDHGAVPMLATLTHTKNDILRRHLAEAIAQCCNWGNNRSAFGQYGAVPPLVKYLKSEDPAVHRSTAKALHQLSRDADNCIAMHENGVVQLLLGMVGSTDVVLQEAAAGTIGNIRRLALESEKSGFRS